MPESLPRVLFVDDDLNLISALKRSLRSKEATWNMTFSTSAKKALQLCNKTPQNVVVTDLMMPEITGTELIRDLNRACPDTACIMLSGNADLQDATDLINTTRVFRFLSKPCATEAIIESVEAALNNASEQSQLPSKDLLAECFSLTRSEARLTEALVMGDSLEAAASNIGITVSSARTYLKRVFSKTDTNRQAELVSKVLLTIRR